MKKSTNRRAPAEAVDALLRAARAAAPLDAEDLAGGGREAAEALLLRAAAVAVVEVVAGALRGDADDRALLLRMKALFEPGLSTKKIGNDEATALAVVAVERRLLDRDAGALAEDIAAVTRPELVDEIDRVWLATQLRSGLAATSVLARVCRRYGLLGHTRARSEEQIARAIRAAVRRRRSR